MVSFMHEALLGAEDKFVQTHADCSSLLVLTGVSGCSSLIAVPCARSMLCKARQVELSHKAPSQTSETPGQGSVLSAVRLICGSLHRSSKRLDREVLEEGQEDFWKSNSTHAATTTAISLEGALLPVLSCGLHDSHGLVGEVHRFHGLRSWQMCSDKHVEVAKLHS